MNPITWLTAYWAESKAECEHGRVGDAQRVSVAAEKKA
jgi:hypothetical protein